MSIMIGEAPGLSNRRHSGLRMVASVVISLGVVLGLMGATASQVAAAPQAANTSDIEQEILRLTNEARGTGRTCGATWYPAVGPVAWDGRLGAAARAHSLDMGTRNYFGHTSPEGSTPGARMRAAGYDWVHISENIAAGYGSVASAVAAWIASPGHCANLMSGSVVHLGVGYANVPGSTHLHYYTQNFAAPASMPTPPSAPTGLVATPGQSSASIAFTAPADNGGSLITNYKYSLDGGASWLTRSPASTASPLLISHLTAGTTYQVRVRAVNSAGDGAQSAAVAVTPTGPVHPSEGAIFVPIDPVRVFDSRPRFGGAGALTPGEYRPVFVGDQIASQGGTQGVVPTSAVAILYNLTVPGGLGGGHLRVMPGSASDSPASVINFVPGQSIANGLVVKVGRIAPGGDPRWVRIANRSSAPADAVVDVVGYFVAESNASQAQQGKGRFTAIAPTRVYESSADPQGFVAPNDTRQVSVADQIAADGGAKDVVPVGAAAVAYNITVVRPDGVGHIRVFPGDRMSSGASAVNWSVVGDTTANGLVVRLAADRTIKVFNSSNQPLRLLVDVTGYYSASGRAFYPMDPARVYDSRAPQPAPGLLATGERQIDRAVSVKDSRGVPGNVTATDLVPPGAGAIAYNLTVTDGVGGGHLRIYPADRPRTGASAINWPAANPAVSRANGSVVAVSDDRAVKLYNGSSAGSNAIIDVLGYYK